MTSNKPSWAYRRQFYIGSEQLELQALPFIYNIGEREVFSRKELISSVFQCCWSCLSLHNVVCVGGEVRTCVCMCFFFLFFIFSSSFPSFFSFFTFFHFSFFSLTLTFYYKLLYSFRTLTGTEKCLS